MKLKIPLEAQLVPQINQKIGFAIFKKPRWALYIILKYSYYKSEKSTIDSYTDYPQLSYEFIEAPLLKDEIDNLLESGYSYRYSHNYYGLGLKAHYYFKPISKKN